MVGNVGLEPTSLSTPVSKTGAVTISPTPHDFLAYGRFARNRTAVLGFGVPCSARLNYEPMVGRGGLEPPQSFDNGFTGHPVCHSGQQPTYMAARTGIEPVITD